MRLKYLFLQFLKYRLTARVHSARRREIVHRRARHIIPKIVSIFSICGQSYITLFYSAERSCMLILGIFIMNYFLNSYEPK